MFRIEDSWFKVWGLAWRRVKDLGFGVLADEGDGQLGTRHGHAGLLDEGLLYLCVCHDTVGDLGCS